MSETSQSRGAKVSVLPGARRLRTDDWPEANRAAIFREQFGRDKVRVDPLPDHPLRIDAMIARFPGLGLVWGRRSPLRSEFSDGSDRLMFSIGSPAIAIQFGKEVKLCPGDAVALSGADSGAFLTLSPAPIVTVEFPEQSLARRLQDPRRACARRIPKFEPSLRLLRSYLRSFLAMDANLELPLRSFATAHIQDLAALSLGPSRHTDEVARLRGLPAARLQKIREDVLNRLDGEMSVDDIAARQSLSPRYVRMLFHREGTTLTEFIRDERLNRARQFLLTPHAEHRSISEIAYSVGFNDLSHFNRSFRRRFGCSPGEMRRSLSP
jgi:AraC-like DNA-binding protein